LAIELRESRVDDRAPWLTSGISPTEAIRGLHSVTLTLRSADRTLELLTGLLGYKVVRDAQGRIRVAAGADAPGHWMELVTPDGAPDAMNGIGTVHHVAMAIGTPEEQLALRADLMAAGRTVTEVRDREYFLSIYFREPGGVLFEVATVKPGFTVDEPLARLGQALKLPPWEEPNRAEIESRLPPLQ
jgi:glyoxalase family protein